MNKVLTARDFASAQPVRWCPGCGDYAILKSLQKTLAELAIPKEDIVIVSGIGCSGRLPYYMNTYGIHGLHGRAPAIATGLKMTRPDCSVWVITGDGDGLSIGANHLLHSLRRNVDIKIILFNNRIYGLTKGQYSPTSSMAQVTGTSPQGTIEQPIDPVRFALLAGATFVARAVDVDASGLDQVLLAAGRHRGAAFVEILQNCPVFNDKAFDSVREKTSRTENMLWLQANEALCFGENHEKGIAWCDDEPVIVDCRDPNSLSQVAMHRPDSNSIMKALRLTQLSQPMYPVPCGVFRQVSLPTFDEQVQARTNFNTIEHTTVQTCFAQGASWKI